MEVLKISDSRYPEKLKEVHKPPQVLWYRGDISLLEKNIFAVVGTRMPTHYGAKITKSFTRDLVDAGFVIISGLARGTDTLAHVAAVEAGAPNIAVLGCGIDIIYPQSNTSLAEKILDLGGLIISEQPPNTPPLPHNFPLRNRIISGLSDGVLVTEAGENSGSLITINHAIEQGKPIFLVPGNITSPMSAGSNRKLKECQGAMVTEINDILINYNLAKIEVKADPSEFDPAEKVVLDALRRENLHFNDLLKLSGLDVSQLNYMLTSLMVSGLVESLPNNSYAIA
jgi:DNA processing protein